MVLAVCVATLAVAVAAGCGDSGDDSVTVEAATDGSTPVESTPEDASELEAIEATIKTWLLEGDCDLMTDGFLEDQTFVDDRKQACKTFEAGFSPPAYTEDDIEVTDVTYVNDKATAIVGGGSGSSGLTSGGEEVTSKYKLVLDGDTWKINAAEIQ
jgi:hypothetical protein